jgi:putative endonuclease
MAQNNHQKGQEGELKALQWYEQNGYTLIKNNFTVYHFKTGKKMAEIDLIFCKDKTLYFVEVKSRKNKKFGLAIEQISRKKLANIQLGATCFIQQNPEYRSFGMQIDAACLDNNNLQIIQNLI